MGRVDLVAAVGGAGGDDPNRRGLRLHGADLHAGGVGAEEFSGIKVEGIFFVSSRMVGRGVESVEAMELVFDFRAIGEREAHAAEDADGFIPDKCERVERADRNLAGGERDVDPGECGAIGDFPEVNLFYLEGGGDLGAGGVEELADGGLVFLGHVLDARSDEGEGAFFAKHGHSCVVERAFVTGSGDLRKRFSLDGFDMLLHVKGAEIDRNPPPVKAKLQQVGIWH